MVRLRRLKGGSSQESNTKWFTQDGSSRLMTITLHTLLWFSIIAIVLSGDMLLAPLDGTLVPSAVLIIAAASTSLIYVLLHNIVSRRRKYGHFDDPRTTPAFRQPIYMGTRLSGLMSFLWLIASGWNLLIASRRPICLPEGRKAEHWQAGVRCICQRAGTAVSIILLIMSCVLFSLIIALQNPYDAHLLGRIKQDTIQKEEVSSFASSSISSNNTHGPLHSHSVSVDSASSGPSDSLSGSPTSVLASRPVSPAPGLGVYAPSSSIVEGTRVNTLAAFQQLQRAASQSTSSLALRPSLNRVASASNISLRSQSFTTQHPLNRVASASNLSLGTHAFGHKRSYSANSFQSNTGASLSFLSQYPGHFSPSRMASSAAMSASAWQAIHPPGHHFRHAPNPGTLGVTFADLATIRKIPMSPSPQFGSSRPKARTSASVSSSSYSGTPHTTSWEHFPVMPPGHVASGGGRPVPYRATSSRSSSTNGVGTSRTGTLKRPVVGASTSSEMIISEYAGPSIALVKEDEQDNNLTISRTQTPSAMSSLSRGNGSLTSFSGVSASSEHGPETGNLGRDRLGRQLSLKKARSAGVLLEGRGLGVWKGKQRAV